MRDKLVYGRETPSRDVDLVLSDVSGREFADFVREHLMDDAGTTAEDGVPLRIRDDSGEGGGKGKGKGKGIGKSKGAQSDHLQNASLLISGFDVDFCRLRNERYDKGSRIPTNVGVASVVEDAWRRDLTINSLYYNINTNEVEDWTERGIIDLVLQSIAMPRKPLPTLLEYPTRILRAIRFAAQLSFDLSPALLRAARDGRVRSALETKVSRDAVGAAIDDMFGTRARDPSRGVRLLMATDLIDAVFPLGDRRSDDGDDGTAGDGDDGTAAGSSKAAIYGAGSECLSRTQSLVTRIFLRSPELDWDVSKRRFLWYAAFLKPVHEMESAGVAAGAAGNNGKRGGRRRESSPLRRLLDALKRTKSDVRSIESILEGGEPIRQMMLEDENNNDTLQSAIRNGTRLGDATPHTSQWEELSELRWVLYCALKPIGAMWKEALILALASSLSSVESGCNVTRSWHQQTRVEARLPRDARRRAII